MGQPKYNMNDPVQRRLMFLILLFVALTLFELLKRLQ